MFTRQFLTGAIGNATMSFSFFMYMSSIAGYSVDVLGASAAMGGIVSGLFVIAATIGRLITAPFVTLVGRRVALMSAVIVFMLASGGYMLADNLAEVVLTRCCHGLGMGVGATTLGAVTLAAAPRSRQAEASGWFGAGLALASGLGPGVATILMRTYGYDAIFLLGFVLSFATVAFTWVMLLEVPKRARGRRFLKPPFTPSAFVTVKALPIGFVTFLPALGFASVLTYLTTYAAERDLARAAGFYFLLYAAVIMVARPLAGIIQDRHGHDIVIIPAIISAGLGLGLTAWAGNGAALLAGGGFLGLGYGTLISAGQAMAISRVGPLDVGLAVGSFYLLVDSGTGAGPIVLGPVAEHFGYAAMLWVGVGLSAVALVIYLAGISECIAGRRRAHP
nr:MFS transporter [Nanchangia anserum]